MNFPITIQFSLVSVFCSSCIVNLFISFPDDFAAMLESALPDDLMWSGDSQGGGGGGGSSGGGGGGVNGMMENSGQGGGGGPTDRSQLSHLIPTKTPPHSMAATNAMATGPHTMPNQNNMIVNALTNSKSPHGGPMQSPQNTNLGMSGVPTSSQPLSMNDSVNNLNNMPNSIANSLAASVAGTMSMASSGAVSSMSLVNTTSMVHNSMANSVGMAGGGMNTVTNINTLNTMNSMNKTQGVVTTMNISGPMATQMNDGMPNGPLPGLNRPMVPTLRGQSPQPMAGPQGMATRHPGLGPGQLGPRLQVSMPLLSLIFHSYLLIVV